MPKGMKVWSSGGNGVLVLWWKQSQFPVAMKPRLFSILREGSFLSEMTELNDLILERFFLESGMELAWQSSTYSLVGGSKDGEMFK